MSAFDLTGTVHQCWPMIMENEEVDPFSTLLEITVIFDEIPRKVVKIFFYKEWAIKCQFLAPGDKVTLSGCKELLREIIPEEGNERVIYIDIREDEVGREPLFIRVSILVISLKKPLSI
jgi:hypothetical protein